MVVRGRPALASLDAAMKLKPGYPEALKAKKDLEAAIEAR